MKKVTAKHLMIGDWVKYGKEYQQIKSLYRTYFGEYKIDINITYGIKSATPIPITEEWLKLNGFELLATNTEMLIYRKGLNASEKITYYTNGIFSYRGSLIQNIRYIHQLQQSYRLATGGKELKIKF